MFLAGLSQQQKETLMCLAHNVVVSDGLLSTGEELMMADMHREMNLDPGFAPHYLPLSGVERIFVTQRSRIIALMALLRLGYADGAFEIEEQFFIRDLAAALNVGPQHLARIENWVRRLIALQQEASDLM
ncbi:MAG: hypothetical protein NWR61_10295 [Pseudomonadales bacterium]|jgi:hypothetical protein|nr:hypothetical protein [Pseudomonadales bacterium]MDP4766718.1 hypothetical protein [Pseudomonadales bacterium]MDP4875854.1 hypothetical protein [Pseudomonadales bacterium]MDP5058168.1 hypothetical protein [Pseudomonadales bacterium]